MQEMETQIVRREEQLNRMRPKYLQAIQDVKEINLEELFNVLFSYKKGDSPEAAVYVLAQAQTLLLRHKKLMDTISYFERMQDSMTNLRSKLPVERTIA
jgi:hypothetical protein